MTGPDAAVPGSCEHPRSRVLDTFGETSLHECEECRIVFSDLLRRPFDARELYESFYRNEVAARFGAATERVVRLFRFFRAFKVFTIAPRAAEILDIGSGRGFMLYYLKKLYGYRRAAGTQISRNAVEFSRRQLGLEVFDRDLLELDLEDASFDIVTMWHVLEHVREPEQYVERIARLLRPGGKLVVEVPNFGSWTRRTTHRYWLGLDLEHHLTFYTVPSLSALLRKHGFSVRLERTFSLEYSTFISVQSLVSAWTRTDQHVFACLQSSRFDRRAVGHLALFGLLAPLCFLVNVLLYWSHRGEVILLVSEKR